MLPSALWIPLCPRDLKFLLPPPNSALLFDPHCCAVVNKLVSEKELEVRILWKLFGLPLRPLLTCCSYQKGFCWSTWPRLPNTPSTLLRLDHSSYLCPHPRRRSPSYVAPSLRYRLATLLGALWYLLACGVVSMLDKLSYPKRSCSNSAYSSSVRMNNLWLASFLTGKQPKSFRSKWMSEWIFSKSQHSWIYPLVWAYQSEC